MIRTTPGGCSWADGGGTLACMRVILNIIWLVFAGVWLTIAWIIAGVLLCITIIGIPFGIQAFKIAGYVIWPFGRAVVFDPDAGAASLIGNILWVILAGWWLALLCVVFGLLLCITIIGIPLGIGVWKLIPIVFTPFGRHIVDADSPAAQAGFAIG